MKDPKLPEPNIIGRITVKEKNGKVLETYEILERTFFAKTLKVNSALRKRVNKDFIHSNTLEEYKFALRVSNGGTLGYRTSAEAINAAANLAKM